MTISGNIEKIITDNEAESQFNVDKLILGCLNIYGVIPLKSFVDTMMDSFEEGNGLMKLSQYVADSELVRVYRKEYRGVIYLVSPFVDNFKEILDMRRIGFKEFHRYAKMSLEAAMAAGENSPYCAAGMETPEGAALRSMLSDIGYEGQELDNRASEIWMYSQYALEEDTTQELFELINDKLDAETYFDVYRRCVSIIAEYSNSSPKWLLKGRTPKEANMMMISIKVDDFDDALESEPVMGLYDMGFAVRPVEKNDPCPCGSGLSYRLCHGRFRN